MKRLIVLALLLCLSTAYAEIPHRYIRLKANPSQVLKDGFVPSGGLGGFDSSLYEEVEGSLPADVTFIKPKALADRLNEIFGQLPVKARAQFYTLKAAVKVALEEGDIEAAKKIVEDAVVPEEFESLKNQMILLFLTNP